jgi:NADPH:quinone reductase-like Zn-dependent oxidoreductase
MLTSLSLQISTVPKPTPGPGQVLVRIAAAALNHRDFFIRQHLYPAVAFDTPMLSDGSGTVVQLGKGVQNEGLLNKLVVLTPMRGWESDPDGPESPIFVATGSTVGTDVGTAQEYIAVPEDEVVLAPTGLSAAEAAALPLAGLTAWRALMIKSGNESRGRNILVTGIGGGVALNVLQFAVAKGCNVYVTSGDQKKIDIAKQMGAKGGVNYKTPKWERELQELLPEERPYLDAIIDGAGGDIVAKSLKLLKSGGVISQYGMTLGPRMDWKMSAVLRNIDLRGATMGSKVEFRDMVAFVDEHKIKPVVSKVVRGLWDLEAVDGLFEEMRGGKQFGKLVIEIDEDETVKAKI